MLGWNFAADANRHISRAAGFTAGQRSAGLTAIKANAGARQQLRHSESVSSTRYPLLTPRYSARLRVHSSLLQSQRASRGVRAAPFTPSP